MGLEINAEKVVMKISTVSAEHAKASGRVIICDTSNNVALSSNAATRKTKCGNIVTTDDPDVVLGGSGVAQKSTSPGTEITAKDIIAWIKSKTLLYFYYSNQGATGIDAGDIVDLGGEGKFNSLTITADIEDPLVTFDWEFTVGGEWTYVPV